MLLLTEENVTNEMSIDAAERRRGFRVRQARPVRVFEPAGARYFGGQTEDVSSTGLRIELPRHAGLRPGEMLNIHVGLNQHGEALPNRRNMMPARVVWVKRPSAQLHGKTEAGIEFITNISARLDAA